MVEPWLTEKLAFLQAQLQREWQPCWLGLCRTALRSVTPKPRWLVSADYAVIPVHERAHAEDSRGRGVVEGCSGAVLVGGQSNRMGKDKALLTIGGTPLIQRVVETLRAVASEVFLVGPGAERYAWLNVQVTDDLVPGAGPLGGIHTALCVARYPRCLVVACDMPFLDVDLLRYMLREAVPWDAVVPRGPERFETLHAVYARSCLKPIEQMIESGNLCPAGLFPHVRVRIVEPHDIASFEGGKRSLMSVNTQADLELARAIADQCLPLALD
jgi:molybdopterin-guanine dinucleotide biosynthesis protein A